MKGLSTKQAETLLQKYGFNEIAEKKEKAWKRLLKKVWGPIPWMIEIALFLSLAMRKWEDVAIISCLLLVNILVDYFQETRALNALESLKKRLAKKALVLRDGKFVSLEARYLVPGDVIKLKIGDIVPADAKLLAGEYLEVDQSALTGESLPVEKKPGEEVYSGAIVKMGEMLAKVTKTGQNTFMGRSADLVKRAQTEENSHFQRAIVRVGNFLIGFSIVLAVVIMAFSLWRHNALLEDLQFILILVVASIPVALPAVLSVTMAIGALAIAKRKAIVSNLPAVEELAGVDVLCSDKTGTLTQNKMTVGEFVTYNDFTDEELFRFAVLSSRKENDDPIEQPIFDYLSDNFDDEKISRYKQNRFIPFDPKRKRTEAIVADENGEGLIVSKGAPQVIVSLCGNTKTTEKLLEDVNRFAVKGFRTLAVAIKKPTDDKFVCVGLISLFDPPRRDSQKVVRRIKELGIKIKMLTGDNQAIAKQIAEKLSIGGKILDVLRFKNAKEEKSERAIKLIDKADGFSQVMPEDKYVIVEDLQKDNHIVAMTGDGVNDAPALQKADIGIAVSGATDAARAAADLVLLKPGLGVIVYAIEIARQTFERMKSYAIFRIAETIRIILFITLSIVVFNFYPVTAIMIIMLALLNDIPVMTIAYDNARIDKRPVRWQMKEILVIASVLGIAGVLSSFLLFYWLQTHNYPLAFIQAMLFIKLDVAGHSTLYLTRAGRHHFWHKPFPSLKFFLPAFGSRIIGTLVAVYGIFMEPIGWKHAGYMWLYALTWWIFNDYVKVLAYKIMDRRKRV